MRRVSTIDSTWDALADNAGPPPERFDSRTLEGLPTPARRWLGRVLPEQTPLIDGVVITMTGQIRIGRWRPFTARQILRAGVGYVWKPVVGGHLLRFVGADVLGPDEARMDFRLHGLVPVARASGPETARSATGRLAAETVAWIPQAATPQAGAVWAAADDHRAIVTLDTAGRRNDVEVTVDAGGRLRAIRLDRWNDSSKPPALEPFGGDLTTELVTEAGVRVAGKGTIGWGYGTTAWDTGQFFRYQLDAVDPAPTQP